jgi:hypothetical protein
MPSEAISMWSTLLAAAAITYAAGAFAQTQAPATGGTTAAGVVPLGIDQPAAHIAVDPPLPAALARGVVVLEYRTENIRIVPVFGPAALSVSPRVGHLHVSVDELPWDWADASGVPVIIQNLPPGPHQVILELNDANHHALDQQVVQFVVPNASQKPHAIAHAGSP